MFNIKALALGLGGLLVLPIEANAAPLSALHISKTGHEHVHAIHDRRYRHAEHYRDFDDDEWDDEDYRGWRQVRRDYPRYSDDYDDYDEVIVERRVYRYRSRPADVVVDAPFTHVYSGPYGRRVVAPFVDVWIPR